MITFTTLKSLYHDINEHELKLAFVYGFLELILFIAWFAHQFEYIILMDNPLFFVICWYLMVMVNYMVFCIQG